MIAKCILGSFVHLPDSVIRVIKTSGKLVLFGFESTDLFESKANMSARSAENLNQCIRDIQMSN
jgi:hypothetical protein